MTEELNEPPFKRLDFSGLKHPPAGEKWERVKPAPPDDHPVADWIVIIGDLIRAFLER